MKKKIAIATILSVAILPFLGEPVSAVYMGNLGQDGVAGADTIEEAIRLANLKVVVAEQNASAGSGTPYFALDGVVGATVISAGIFGGIAATFFVRSRYGKYAEIGRG